MRILCGTGVALCGLIVPLAAQMPQLSLPSDWSQQHIVFPATNSTERQSQIEQDPRFNLQQLRRDYQQFDFGSPDFSFENLLQADWREATGTAPLALSAPAFPAKFSYNVTNATPSCANDYVVYTLPNSGSGMFNIIAWNNLYVSPGSFGICGVSSPTVLFAYNASRNGGTLSTAPALSLDGTQIAFIENASTAEFHILKWHAGDKPGSFPKPFNSGALANCATNGGVAPCEYSVTYSGTTATLSFPYIDYSGDNAWVSDDNGNVSAIHPVFTATPANPPQVVAGFPLAVGHGVMTGPIFDSVSGNVFVADPTRLYYVRTSATSAGGCATGSPPCVGSSSQTISSGAGAGSMLEPPIVDSTDGWVFAFAWSGPPYNGATIVQSNTTLSTINVAEISGSAGGSTPTTLHAGTFDNAYFTNPASGKLYACGENNGGHFGTLWAASFTSAGMKVGHASYGPLNLTTGSVAGNTPVCSSLSEAYNSSAGVDYLFTGIDSSCAFGGGSTGCIFSFDITNGFPGQPLASYPSPGGSSGIIVDNVTGSLNNATNLYYLSAQPLGAGSPCSVFTGGSNTTGNCAVKLSQPAGHLQ